MIYSATTLIANELEKAGFKYKVLEAGPLSYVESGFTGNNQSCIIRAISEDNDNDVKIMSADFARFPKDKIEKGYALINSMNRTYKHAKFCIDDDGDLCAQCDLPSSLSDSEVGKVAVELLFRLAKIIDDAYPKIMKEIWS